MMFPLSFEVRMIAFSKRGVNRFSACSLPLWKTQIHPVLMASAQAHFGLFGILYRAFT